MTLEKNEFVASSDDSKASVSSGEESKDSVSYESYKKLMNQFKNNKEKSLELQKRIEEFEVREKEREEVELRKQGEIKKLLLLKEEENKKLKENNDLLNQQWDEAIKFSALREKLPGSIRDDDCYSIIKKSLKDIVIDPTTGNVVEDSVSQVAENLIKNKIYLFDVKGSSGMPANAPKSSGQLTIEQWKTLPLKERKERMHEVMNMMNK